MRTPTGRRGEIWRFIQTCNMQGFSPSYEEIGAACGVNKATAWEHVAVLERGGWVVKPGKKKTARMLSAVVPEELVPDGHRVH